MTIRIGTSEAGGTFDSQGKAIAALINSPAGDQEKCELRTTLASIDNANRLDRGEIEFGFMASNWAPRAVAGTAPFHHAIPLRMVSPANAGPLFFVSLAGASIADIKDLIGKRVAVGPETSGMTQHVHTIFDILGISFDDFRPLYMNFPEGAEALIAGRADAQFQCPIPNKVMTDLSQKADVKVIPYAAGQIEQILARVPFYRRVVMKRGAFRGLTRDTRQIAVLNVLVTHERVDTKVVQRVASTMIQNAARLAQVNPLFEGLSDLYEPLRAAGAKALEVGGVPLHPGAIEAYRDAGYL